MEQRQVLSKPAEKRGDFAITREVYPSGNSVQDKEIVAPDNCPSDGVSAGDLPAPSTASRMREARESAGHTQSAIAKSMGVSQNCVWRYESGLTEPTAKALRAYARACDTSADWLLCLTKTKETAGAIRKKAEQELREAEGRAREREAELTKEIADRTESESKLKARVDKLAQRLDRAEKERDSALRQCSRLKAELATLKEENGRLKSSPIRRLFGQRKG